MNCPDQFYEGEREVQRQAGVRDVAERMGRMIRSTIPATSRDFVSRQSFAVVATTDSDNHVWGSLPTGDPGFIEVTSDNRLMIRARPVSDDPLRTHLTEDQYFTKPVS